MQTNFSHWQRFISATLGDFQHRLISGHSQWPPVQGHFCCPLWTPMQAHFSHSLWSPVQAHFSRSTWFPIQAHFSHSLWSPVQACFCPSLALISSLNQVQKFHSKHNHQHFVGHCSFIPPHRDQEWPHAFQILADAWYHSWQSVLKAVYPWQALVTQFSDEILTQQKHFLYEYWKGDDIIIIIIIIIHFHVLSINIYL